MTKRAKRESRRIVIIGGGYVGFHAYKAIMAKAGRMVRSGEITITLIDPRTDHAFHGWSGETMAGALSDAARLSPLRKIFRHARVVRGYATQIDEARRIVHVRSTDGSAETTISYDHLVIGAGVEDCLDAMEGSSKHGVTLRRGAGPEGLRTMVTERIERAEICGDPEERARLLSFVIVGGGFTGVETTAAIAEYIEYLRADYEVLRRREESITLVHTGNTLLPEMEGYGKLVDYTTSTLLEKGVHLRLGLRGRRVTSDGLELSDGTRIASRCVVITVGTKVREIPGGESWKRDANGRIVANEFLQREGSIRIWVGGDGAHVRRRGDDHPTPPNALWAIKHGEWIGKNIISSLTGGRLTPFTYKGLGQAASLGTGKGIVEFRGLQFSGVIGWTMRLGFFLWFVPSRRTAFRGLMEWLTLPLTGRATGIVQRGDRTSTERPVTDTILRRASFGGDRN